MSCSSSFQSQGFNLWRLILSDSGVLTAATQLFLLNSIARRQRTAPSCAAAGGRVFTTRASISISLSWWWVDTEDGSPLRPSRLHRICYWRWTSPSSGGRPQIDTELRALIRQMSIENPLWGAPRIHGELLKLGFEVAQSSVAKYMVKRRGSPSPGWRTFLRNHAPDIVAMDLFVVPTIGFDLLYALVIVRLDRRDLVWINVTRNPTAEWVAPQITEAFPWDGSSGYMIRDP